MTFEAVRATAVDRERGIELIQPWLERGAMPGEVEMQYSVHLGNRIEIISCKAIVDEHDGHSQTWRIQLGPTQLVGSLMRIQAAAGDRSPPYEFLKDIANAMTLVYACGYDVYVPTRFIVETNQRNLQLHGIQAPSGEEDVTGQVILSDRQVSVTFEAMPVPEYMQPEPDGGVRTSPSSGGGPVAHVFASGRANDGSSNVQRAFDYLASIDATGGTILHTPFGRVIDAARSSDEYTIVSAKLRQFLEEKGIRPFLGKYRNAAVDMLINSGCRAFAEAAVESGSCLTFLEGYVPHSRFAHTDLPILQAAPNVTIYGPPPGFGG